MVLNLENLNDESIRELMLQEVNKDEVNEKIYISSRLKDDAKNIYIQLLKKAIQSGDDNSLAQEIINKNCLKTHMPRRTPSGGTTMARIPNDAHLTLAEGEFNRFYLRAICLKVISDKEGDIVVYRAKEVRAPRPESQAMIGKIIDANKLLEDLRNNIGVDTAIGLPQGPNSGLSGKIRK